ncbi:NUDIX hydrolase [Endozoicomonadaceae bacterium StTr2]
MLINKDKVNGRRVKVCPVITRAAGQGTELLVFQHPLAGTQLIKGTVEPDEGLFTATLRELREESGIENSEVLHYIGNWSPDGGEHEWHFIQCAITGKTTTDLPDSWEHFCEDAGGHMFRFCWHPLQQPASDQWHPMFQEGLLFLRDRLQEVPKQEQ